MKLLTGLFRASRKRLMTTDNDMGMFRDKLNELVAQKDTLSDEEISAKVEELKEITNDLPDDEGKEKLLRFLEDFKAVKEQDQKVAEEAAAQVADQFEKLDTAAMQDVPGAEEAAEEITEETVEGSEPADAGEEVTEEEIEKVAEETQDETPAENAEYTLEEIYQFIKKRMAEDTNEPEETVAEEVTEEELGDAACEEEETTNDHGIAVTLDGGQKAGSLASMFAEIKGGRK